ncbi:RlpA-like double-psi beta-barrel-protein domain-containing protein-containing protein [Lentinula edodes]|uniref:RlpA-like double-psi beta-barrel-protein domain-containing protein-containing protein n=1 Tax=Lentinula lateritia TaxID=40482 RepID=A0A9W9AAG9_9AGAR|nr:RlpA-like double-psi beta-barrel-protein domain-containing protein-containing protein [Lentinula edodes]
MFTFMIASVILAFVSSSSLVAGMAIPIRKSLEDKRSVTVTDFSGGSGDGTYYDAGLGACGITNTDTDYIAAIGEDFFDQYAIHMGVTSGNPNENPICNKKVIATYQGKSVTVAITDRCGGCTNPYSLDFTPTAFSQLADQSVGRITGMTWVWADSDSSDSGSDSGSSSSSSSSSATDSSPSTDSSSGWSSSSSAATPTDANTAAGTVVSTASTASTDTWTSAMNTWTSAPGSPTGTSTSTSSTSSITAGAVDDIGSLNVPSISSGFITRSSSSVFPSGTALGGSNPVTTSVTTQASKQSSGARRSIQRLWEF